MEERIREIEAMSWREIKTLATNLGISKTDDQQWEDLAPAIAAKETETTKPQKEVLSIEQPSSIEDPVEQDAATSFDYIQQGGHLVCPVCNQPARTGQYKRPVCPLPVTHPTCPRQ